MLTLNFKIVPDTLVSDTGGKVNHLLLSMLTLKCIIVPDSLVSVYLGKGQSFSLVHANY